MLERRVQSIVSLIHKLNIVMLANSSQRRELNGLRRPRTYDNLRPDRTFEKEPLIQRAVQPLAAYRLFPRQSGDRRTQDQGPGRGGQRRESPYPDRARYDVERLDVRVHLEDGLPEPRRHLGQREVPQGRDVDADSDGADPGRARPCLFCKRGHGRGRSSSPEPSCKDYSRAGQGLGRRRTSSGWRG